MPYIGNKTADTTLVEDNSITSAKIVNDSVIESKLNLISTSSVPSLEAKGTSGVTEGYIQLNCAENSHGIKIKSAPHSANANYTLTLPNNDGDANQFLQTDGSGVLSFASAGLSNWSENSGNLLPSNSSYGIYLGVNSATASNLLDDYEEGTFTPTWSSNVSSSVASGNYGYYTKIGKQVTVYFGAVLNATSPSYYQMTNAPFQSNIPSGNAIGTGREYGHTGTLQLVYMSDNSTTVNVRKYDTSAVSNAYLHCQITYRTD